MKYCSNCGKQLPDEAAFCDECGSRVEQYKKTMPDRKAQTRMERKPQKKAKKKSFLGFIFKLLFLGALIGGGYFWLNENFPELFNKKPHISIPSIPGLSSGGNNNGSSSSNNNGLSIIPDGDPSPSGENLSFADFNFYEEVMANGVPDGAVFVEGGYADGDWKYNFRINMYDEIGMAFVDVEGESMRLELYPRYVDNGSSLLEIDNDSKYQPFTGGYVASEGNVKLVGNNTVIYITKYYAYEGREYMIGTAWFSEDDSCPFLMTRGQN